jgi:hypothetical protein
VEKLVAQRHHWAGELKYRVETKLGPEEASVAREYRTQTEAGLLTIELQEAL